MINFLINLGVAGESASVNGVALNPDRAHTTFTTAWLSK
jgi:hypothetical protein